MSRVCVRDYPAPLGALRRFDDREDISQSVRQGAPRTAIAQMGQGLVMSLFRPRCRSSCVPDTLPRARCLVFLWASRTRVGAAKGTGSTYLGLLVRSLYGRDRQSSEVGGGPFCRLVWCLCRAVAIIPVPRTVPGPALTGGLRSLCPAPPLSMVRVLSRGGCGWVMRGPGGGGRSVLSQSEDQSRPHPAQLFVRPMSTQVRSPGPNTTGSGPRSDPQNATHPRNRASRQATTYPAHRTRPSRPTPGGTREDQHRLSVLHLHRTHAEKQGTLASQPVSPVPRAGMGWPATSAGPGWRPLT